MSLLRLSILVPDRVALEAEVSALQAADSSGRFGLLPQHELFLTVLVPCLITYRDAAGREGCAAVDGGILLLEDGRLTIVTAEAVVADVAAARLRARREEEAAARLAFAELEAMLLRELPAWSVSDELDTRAGGALRARGAAPGGARSPGA